MKNLLKRVEFESNFQSYNAAEIPLDYFPLPTQACSSDYFKPRAGLKCKTGLYDMLRTPIIKIADKDYYLTEEGIKDLLEKRSMFGNNTYKRYVDNIQ